MLSHFSDVTNISRASSHPIVRCCVLEDYNPSEEINLLDEGIDRYFGIKPRRYGRIGLGQNEDQVFRE